MPLTSSTDPRLAGRRCRISSRARACKTALRPSRSGRQCTTSQVHPTCPHRHCRCGRFCLMCLILVSAAAAADRTAQNRGTAGSVRVEAMSSRAVSGRGFCLCQRERTARVRSRCSRRGLENGTAGGEKWSECGCEVCRWVRGGVGQRGNAVERHWLLLWRRLRRRMQRCCGRTFDVAVPQLQLYAGHCWMLIAGPAPGCSCDQSTLQLPMMRQW